MNRRQAITSLAGAGIALAAGPSLAAPMLSEVQVTPLPFKPGALRGLSAKLIASHHGRNYSGAVKKLNGVRAELAKLDARAPGFVLGALKSKELVFRNSVVLHELYFANLGGRGGPSKRVSQHLSRAFGSVTEFEKTLKRTALTQAGGSGWTLLSLDLTTSGLTLEVAADHSRGGAASLPVLALDMYEHSYAIDYGANAARYVEAFYDNVNWDEVQRRLDFGLGFTERPCAKE